MASEPEPEPTPESVKTLRKFYGIQNNKGIGPNSSLIFERVGGPYGTNQKSALKISGEQIQQIQQEPDAGLELPRRNKPTTEPNTEPTTEQSVTKPIDIPSRPRAKLKYKKSKRKKPSKKRKNKHKKKQTKKHR